MQRQSLTMTAKSTPDLEWGRFKVMMSENKRILRSIQFHAWDSFLKPVGSQNGELAEWRRPVAKVELTEWQRKL